MIYSENRTKLGEAEYDDFAIYTKEVTESFDEILEFIGSYHSLSSLNEADMEIIEEDFKDTINKIKSVFTSSFAKLKKRKDEVAKLEKDVAPIEDKYSDIKSWIKETKGVGIANYEPLEDITNIRAGVNPLLDSLLDIFATPYNEIVDSTANPEAYKKAMSKNPKLLSDSMNKIKKNYKDFDVEKKVDTLFGMAGSKGEEKMHIVTDKDIDLFIKGKDNIEKLLDDVNTAILDYEDHGHQLNQGVIERNKVRSEQIKNESDEDPNKDYYKYAIEAAKTLSSIYTIEFGAFDKCCGCFIANSKEYFRRLSTYLASIESAMKYEKSGKNGVKESSVQATDEEILYEGVLSSVATLSEEATFKIAEIRGKVPKQYHISISDFDDLNSNSVFTKIKNGSACIKDEKVLNSYFKSILSLIFMYNCIVNEKAYEKDAPETVRKMYDLYKERYKGDKAISLESLYKRTAGKIKMLYGKEFLHELEIYGPSRSSISTQVSELRNTMQQQWQTQIDQQNSMNQLIQFSQQSLDNAMNASTTAALNASHMGMF